MPSKKILIIIKKYLNNEASYSDIKRLIIWLDSKENITIFKEYVSLEYLINKNLKKFETTKLVDEILNFKENKAKIRVLNFKRLFKYAATIIVLVAIAYFFTKENSKIDKPILVNSNIEKGTDKATLTLGDGSTIILSKEQKYVSDEVSSDGEKLIYQESKDKATISKREIVYNYLTIPRGGKFYLELADQTKIWLNSESKIKYPVEFHNGQTREVELLYGEAYYEVSPSSNHHGDKFRVITQGQDVEVFGTEFNIKAYKGEEVIKTTLVAGSISLNIDKKHQLLIPSQQSVFYKKTGEIDIKMVNTTFETSWKKGLFNFNEKSLTEIMKVLSRWYDIDIEIQNKSIKKLLFKGSIGKDQQIETILITLKNTKNISYEITDNKIIIK